MREIELWNFFVLDRNTWNHITVFNLFVLNSYDMVVSSIVHLVFYLLNNFNPTCCLLIKKDGWNCLSHRSALKRKQKRKWIPKYAHVVIFIHFSGLSWFRVCVCVTLCNMNFNTGHISPHVSNSWLLTLLWTAITAAIAYYSKLKLSLLCLTLDFSVEYMEIWLPEKKTAPTPPAWTFQN